MTPRSIRKRLTINTTVILRHIDKVSVDDYIDDDDDDDKLQNNNYNNNNNNAGVTAPTIFRL